ncbi:hypothetical protein Bbelb_393110 [Branchiostoma belcheri]|nr:hypothetical protein Bbelb_393110 [Branchiostoma belcheri]
MADFDQVLKKHIGELGPYQIWWCFLVYLPAIPCCMHMFSMVFIGATPVHYCATPELDLMDLLLQRNASWAERMNATIPWELTNGVWHHSSCTRYNLSDEYSNLAPTNTTAETFNMAANLSITDCDAGWEYDRSQFHTSVTMEFDLVCNRKWLNNLAQSILMVGVLCGAVLFGDLSDRYGRKLTFFIVLSLQVIFGVANAFTHSYAAFVCLRFLVGACAYPVFMIAFVIGQEIVGPSKRALAGSVIELAFAAAIMVLAGLAYAIREWTFLQLAITLPSAVSILSWWLIPESPRWLIARGRVEEAMEVIHLMAKRNGKTLPSDLDLDVKTRVQRSSGGQPSALDLVRTPNMLRKSVLIFFNWFVVTILYYGLSLGTSDLAGDDYVNFFLSGVVEVPGYLSSCVVIERFGRRVPHMLYMVVGGVACVAAAFIPKHLTPLTITLVMIGKFGAAGAFNIIYIWTGELYPTVVRNVGVGVSVLWSRCGGIASPFIGLLKDVWGPLPLIILGAPACLAGALALILPETLGLPLPQTSEEAEHFGSVKRDAVIFMETPGWIYFVVTILGIIIAVTLIGCLLTVLAIWTRPVLRKLVNAPLVSLSCTDILSSSFGAPLLIHAFLHPDWEPPGALCWLQSYVTIVLWGASSCHMACIALQRYFMVCTNSVYLKSKRVLFIILLLTWLIPTVSFLPIHVVEEVKVHPKLKRCGLGASPNLWGKIVPSILSFYGPFIATITLYALIRYHVRKSKKRVGAHANPLAARVTRTDERGPFVGTASAKMTKSSQTPEDSTTSVSMGDQNYEEDKRGSVQIINVRPMTDQKDHEGVGQGKNPPSYDDEECENARYGPVQSTKSVPTVSVGTDKEQNRFVQGKNPPSVDEEEQENARYGPVHSHKTVSDRVDTDKEQNRVGQLGNSSPNNAAEKQLTRMMMTLFSVYTVCYMPLITMAIFSSRVPREAFIVGQVLMALNGALNPILYGLMNRNIRQGYKHIWNSMLNYIV